jgi:TolA-binding protein
MWSHRIVLAAVLIFLVAPFALRGQAQAQGREAIAAADRAAADGDYERALEFLRPLAAQPGAATGAEALARIMAWSQDGDEVGAAASALLEHHGNHPQAASAAELVGHYRAARGEYRASARYFEVAASKAPPAAAARLSLLRARALVGAGEGASALAVLDELLPAARDAELRGLVILVMADAYLAKGDREAAARAYEEFIAGNDASDYAPVALSQLAKALDELGEADRAVETLRRLVDRYPDSVAAASARDRLRRVDRARATDSDPQATVATTPKGRYSLQVGAFGSEDNAQELARKLIDLGLDDVRIEREQRNNRLFFRVRVGSYRDPEEAEQAGESLRRSHGIAYQIVVR